MCGRNLKFKRRNQCRVVVGVVVASECVFFLTISFIDNLPAEYFQHTVDRPGVTD